MQSTTSQSVSTSQDEIALELFGRRLINYCQANPDVATELIDRLIGRDSMARSLACTIRQSVVEMEKLRAKN